LWYHYPLVIPAGTPESAPVVKELFLTYGIVVWLGIPWLPGPNSLVKVRIYRLEHQIFPLNPDEPACGDSFLEGGIEHLGIYEPPFNLVARGYSPDCTHDHTVTILVNVLPELVAEPWRWQFLAQPQRVIWPI